MNTSTYTRLNGGKDHLKRGSSGCILLVLKISSSCNSGLKLCCLMIGLTPMIQSFEASPVPMVIGVASAAPKKEAKDHKYVSIFKYS